MSVELVHAAKRADCRALSAAANLLGDRRDSLAIASQWETTVRTQTILAVVALLASGTAVADGAFSHTGTHERGPTAAALYLEVPLGASGRQNAKPILGLRLQQLPLTPLGAAGSDRWHARTLLDVPLLRRDDDPLRDAPASNLLGKGVIVGIVVGAVVAVSVLNDDDDGSGGGY